MASNEPSRSNLPPSLGPGARPIDPKQQTPGGITELMNNRSQYHVHVDNSNINLNYELKGRRRQFILPMDNIPIQGWTRSLAWGGSNTAMVSGVMVIDLIRGMENVTGRDITQAEAEATAWHASRRMMTAYVGQFTAVGVGIGMAFYGRGRMKFPFRKPQDPSRYTSFPFQRFAVLRGAPARLMWQITRYNLYIFLSLLLINPFVYSIADSRMTVGLYRDPRTRDLTLELKDRVDRVRSNRASAAGKTKQPENGEANSEQNSSIMDAIRRDGQTEFSADNTFTDQNTDTGLLTDSAVSQRETQQTPPNSWSEAQSRASRPTPKPKAQQQQQDSGSFFDDASPTAGNEGLFDTQIRDSQQPRGSAWSKVRRGESRPELQGSWKSQTPDFETKADSFSFSNSESDKRLAKDQARKEFDAMLERERREGGSDAYVRDMNATQVGEDSKPSASAWSRRRGG